MTRPEDVESEVEATELDPFLESCVRRYQEAVRRAKAVAEGVEPAMAVTQPTLGSWSFVECVGHLNTTLDLYLPKMEQAQRKARDRPSRKAPSPIQDNAAPQGTVAGRWLLRFVDPESRKKVPSLRMFLPPATTPDRAETALVDALRRFEGLNDALCALAKEADGLPLGRLRLATPASRWIRLSLAQAFELHARHQFRHLEQGERAIELVVSAPLSD